MSILSVKSLLKRFKDFTAVNNVSFELGEAEILGFLGSNGAGKTTTIQMLMGILTPTSGSVSYFGKNLVTHREEILEKVNFSSTYTNLPWSLTVQDNLTFISYLYDIKNRKQQVEKVVSLFKLGKLLNMPVTELSAGQTTRVNLAKAFINEPKVLLLDEPTASLDPEVAQYVRDFILEERRKNKLSILFTSHNMQEVEDVCDRVLFINNGTIIADDTPINLARKIEFSHIQLYLDDTNMKHLLKFVTDKNYQYKQDKHRVTITIKEKEIPLFLGRLISRKIHFEEISIEKPNLEDYFLQVASDGAKEASFETVI
ncbi:MAG: ABC transporter ATP-binding protein [Weeksellaceae bacterium]